MHDAGLEKEPDIAPFSMIDCQVTECSSHAWQEAFIPKMLRPFVAAGDDVQELDGQKHLTEG